MRRDMAMSAIAIVDGGSGATITDWIGSILLKNSMCRSREKFKRLQKDCILNEPVDRRLPVISRLNSL